MYVSTPFSLRQMEQNITDLKKIEEETKEKVSGVNSQKVAVVKAFVDSIKVNKLWFIRRFSWSSLRSSSTWLTTPFTFLCESLVRS